LPQLRAAACTQLWERFRPGQTPPESLGPNRDFNVDMVPKFIMANGNLVKVLACFLAFAAVFWDVEAVLLDVEAAGFGTLGTIPHASQYETGSTQEQARMQRDCRGFTVLHCLAAASSWLRRSHSD